MTFQQKFYKLKIETNGQGFTDITTKLKEWIKEIELIRGVIYLTLLHTSCSLIVNENADPKVLEDLTKYMNALVPEEQFQSYSPIEGQKFHRYKHFQEGPDDMPAHIKTSLTSTSLTLSVNEAKLILGTWQAVYLWEHRFARNSRTIHLHAMGTINKNDSCLNNISDCI